MRGIQIKRAYDEVGPDDGYRVLVDRLWPRGVKKEDLRLDLWLKEIAPSPEESYFVMGDNRDDSADSRLWGFVPRENVIGTPLVIYLSVETNALPSQFGYDSGDRLSNLKYLAAHIFRDIRWKRMLRLVR